MASEPPVSPAMPAREPEQTLHLERSALTASPASPQPDPPAGSDDQYQPTIVSGTVRAAQQRASLMVRSGPDSGARFALDASPIYIGRAHDNGIVVSDPATSRRHARFEQRGHDYLVVDLGSANGTLVDGKRVVEEVVAGGAVISMGQNEFVVSIQLEDVEEK
jgi:pSer/pThr/pTyr-binding forkhead associated (FHA) protein